LLLQGDADAAAPNATVVILRAEIVLGTGEVQESAGAPKLARGLGRGLSSSPGSDLCDVNYNNQSICTDTGIQAVVLLNSRGGSSSASAS